MDTVRATLETTRAELLAQMAVLETPPSDRGSISFGKRVGEGTAMAVDRLSQVAVHDNHPRNRHLRLLGRCRTASLAVTLRGRIHHDIS